MADYYPVISRAITALDNKSREARSAVYDRARAALVNQLQNADPLLSETDLEHERLALEDAINKVEAGTKSRRAGIGKRLTMIVALIFMVAPMEHIDRTLGIAAIIAVLTLV